MRRQMSVLRQENLFCGGITTTERLSKGIENSYIEFFRKKWSRSFHRDSLDQIRNISRRNG